MNYTVLIPARYNASRLPGKLLLPLGDKTILQHTYEKALASGATQVVIATDDERIRDSARSYGAQVCMTSPAHQEGTSRIAEAVRHLQLPDNEIIVNLQGDEPLVPACLIHQVAHNLMQHADCMMATLCEAIKTQKEYEDPSIVKVVFDQQGHALYFSRAGIPYQATGFLSSYRHIGLYAYRVASLQQYVAWQPSPLEKVEQLEQLRVLWHQGKIHIELALEPSPNGVNTPKDYEALLSLVSAQKNLASA